MFADCRCARVVDREDGALNRVVDLRRERDALGGGESRVGLSVDFAEREKPVELRPKKNLVRDAISEVIRDVGLSRQTSEDFVSSYAPANTARGCALSIVDDHDPASDRDKTGSPDRASSSCTAVPVHSLASAAGGPCCCYRPLGHKGSELGIGGGREGPVHLVVRVETSARGPLHVHELTRQSGVYP